MHKPGHGHDGGAQTRRSSRSATERPTSTAGRHMGRVRNRSITPLLRSVLKPDGGPHGRRGQVEGQQAGDGEIDVGASPGEHHPGTEDVDEQQGEEHRLDGHVGQLERLPGDVHQVAAGQGDDVADLAGPARAPVADAAGGDRRW